MKVYKHLWKKIITFENFKLAYKNATKGKKHYKEVKLIERKGVNSYLRKLLEEVKSKQYKVSNYDIFTLFTGEKVREIYRLPMKDRIVQHALMNIIELLFRETFIKDTYSSIKGRGIHPALKRVKRVVKSCRYTHYLKVDIRKCYPSIDKEILKSKLARKFRDNDLLWLLFTIIDSCDKGLPIGNYTSQYFNNFYFSDLDHYFKEHLRVKEYFRYCDDIVIFAESKEELHKLLKILQRKIAELNVNLKDNYQIYNIEVRSVDFLGYKTRRNYTLIRKYTKRRFINKASKMNFNNLSVKDINTLGSYWGIFVHANCRNLWYKYTGMKTFKDLNISVHKRDFVRDILGIELTITNSNVFPKRGQEWLRFECSYIKNNDKNELIIYDDVYVSTSAEKLVEAGKQFNPSMYPFKTTINVDDKGFYEFN